MPFDQSRRSLFQGHSSLQGNAVASLQLIYRFGAIAGLVESLSYEHAAEDIELGIPVPLVANAASHRHVRAIKRASCPRSALAGATKRSVSSF
jgi:hypothetical protein